MVNWMGIESGMYNVGTSACPDNDFGRATSVLDRSTREIVGSYMKEFGDAVSGSIGSYIKTKMGGLLQSRSDAWNYLHDKCGIPEGKLDSLSHMKDEVVQSLSMAGYDIHLRAVDAAYKIPDWVKKTAGWWSERKVSDGEFVNGLTYMIKNKIIQVPEVASNVADKTQSIPDWVRNNAAYWSNGQITDMDFVNGIQYLIQHGIIQI